jgi:OOP family OmpA-OmpF porin
MSVIPVVFRRVPAVFAASLLFTAAPLAAGDSPWYVEGRAGQASVATRLGSVLPWRIDGDDTAAGVEVGYRINRFVAVQAGYHDLGRYDGARVPCREGDLCPLAIVIPEAPVVAEITGWSLTAVPRWPIGERFAVFGKVGLFEWDADLTRRFDGGREESFSDSDLLAGVGVQVAFAGGLGLELQYEDYDLGADATTLGASWRF